MDYLKLNASVLVGIINTKLRNNYSDLDELCYDLGIIKEGLVAKLNDANYHYDKETNSFK